MPVADYMAFCLYDAQAGYYMARNPLGRDGDFTTAPEISQMFGELVGAWLVAVWRMQGRPANPVFAEIGPGRGVLSADIARTFDRLEPGLRAGASYVLVETSPRLAQIQTDALARLPGSFAWAKTVDELPPNRPLFVVGNELFDAIPARQFVNTGQGWRERCVGLTAEGALQFVAGPTMIDPAILPPEAAQAPDGAIFETAPAREALAQTLAARIARDGGVGLFFDYGHLRSALGDTFQAMRAHGFVDPLAEPGEADLTTHVDFAALASVAKAAGLSAHLTTQGEFLLSLGLLERAGQLGANRDAATQDRIRSEVERLAAPDAMGDLFKVIAFAARGLELPGFPAPAP